MIKRLLIFLVLFTSTQAFANKVSCVPSIRIGYVFTASVSFGIDIDVLFNASENLPEVKYGFSFSQSYVKVKIRNVDKGFHSMYQLNGVIQNNYVDFRFGRGHVSNNWGYQNRSKCVTSGSVFELSFTHPDSFIAPWVGLNIQKIKSNWEWFDTSYYQAFTRLKFPTEKKGYNNIFSELKKLY